MNQTVRVPLYAIRHGQIGGTERAIYNLLHGLAATGTRVVVPYGRDADLSPHFLAWARDTDQVRLQRTGGLPGPKAIRFAQELLFQNARKDRDWAIFPNYFCPPARLRRKSSVILHDIQYKQYPQYHSAKRRAWLDFYLPKMFAMADSIIVLSNSELAMVRKYFGDAAAARCDMVHNAIEFTRFEDRDDAASDTVRELVKHRYIFSVCHQFPHKNVGTLLKAFSQVAQRDRSIRLYMVGLASVENLKLIQSALPDVVRDRVNVMNSAADADLGLLYANAQLFVMPSLYEGFGMPAVEALGMGVPTIVSNAYSLPEVTLGYAGLIDDPLDIEAWVNAIETALAAGTRPTSEQQAHIRATYHPVTIAGQFTSALARRDPTA